MTDTSKSAAANFISKWTGVTASELSTAQSFVLDLCSLLGVPTPHPDVEQQYMFERPITFAHGDGSVSAGRIDLYKRGCFVLEAKKLRQNAATRGFDDAMLRARSQAEQYARALPASETRPPFLVVVDIGNRIELYAEFSRSGATYTPFPDPSSHRIALAELADENVRERLRRIWSDPLTLDPSRASTRVTREIAAKLAELAKSLERAKNPPELVAQFLMRCLFTMFAEDVTLLPRDALLNLLQKYRDDPAVAMRMLAGLWRDMDAGGFSVAIAAEVLRFNGKLFKLQETLPLDKAQLALLIEAARAKWEHVEPAIFGTLLERALDPAERHKLGAHFTPRAYVEQLVLPTIIEPLRTEWNDVKAAVLVQMAEAEHARTRGLSSEGRKSQSERLKQSNIELRKARDLILGFHKRLCEIRVLDPACGSGNFLYVTLEHLKRLEGEVLNAIGEFGLSRLGVAEQTSIDVHGERVIAEEAQTVDPHNLLGIEVNPRAAAIAEVVLWIGYLQWHYRTRGNINPPQPVVRDFHNIECRDALLAYDKVEYVTDESGRPVTRWDGKTTKISPITGEEIPDDSARVPLEHYMGVRKASWPQADFIVGNPPFMGKLKIRESLGDGYVDALRETWTEVPASADLVMYWWQHAAVLARTNMVRRFGFITTNSIRQTFNQRILETHLTCPKDPLALVFALSDHPWVDSSDGAAVRIAMTVGTANEGVGRLAEVVSESELDDGEIQVVTRDRSGIIHADLRLGADVAKAIPLRANGAISNVGVIPHGEGFIVARAAADSVDAALLKEFRNGKDLAGGRARDVLIIDTCGLGEEELRARYPATYQWLHERVKPERDQNPRETRRVNWWLYGENHPRMRASVHGLQRYIGTVLTSKHRTFFFIDGAILPDQTLVVTGSSDALHMGVMSSQVHVTWALAAGGRLGVGNDPRYNKTRCFETFPFPVATPHDSRIRSLTEQLDAHRKRQQAKYPDLTLTGMYNVLEKLRSSEPLTAKERKIHEHGLVSILRQLHDEIDASVLDAYGWNDLLPLLQVAHGSLPATDSRDDAKRAFDEAVLERLVRLNAERAAEESRGLVRWLRPEFQNPKAQTKPRQADLGAETDPGVDSAVTTAIKARPWPKDAIEQVRAVARLLGAAAAPVSVDDIAAQFIARGPWKKRLPQVLEMLVALGRARQHGDGCYVSA